MKFGIFDHLDASGLPLPAHYEARLQMAQAYDRLGFHCYHLAEHHGTPLGHAPSPLVFLAALSQRTSRLRFGPLVCLLPLYHPLRLIEEIAMLDGLSGGRLEFGHGRGISPIEMGFYAVAADEQHERAQEALEVVLKGLTQDRLSHRGRFFEFADVPMIQRPVQHPHPPLWYGTNSPASVAACARQRRNLVTLATGDALAAIIETYRREYLADGGDLAAMPLLGVGRHILVADTDAQAEALARPAFARWRASFVHLWHARGASHPGLAHFPKDWDAMVASGAGCAGSPATVREFVQRQARAAGFSYFVGQFAFGDLGVAEVERSASLFAAEVMTGWNPADGA